MSIFFADYEERDGQPPQTRSMEEIPNVHAIVQFDTVFQVDNQGGRSIEDVPDQNHFAKRSIPGQDHFSTRGNLKVLLHFYNTIASA